MSPINYLRGVVMRDRPVQPTATTPPPPPREIPWANAVRTDGACPHDVIYSSCNCPPTEAADH